MVDSCWFSRVGLRRLIVRHAWEMGTLGTDCCSSDGILREGHMDIYTTKMQTTAPRDETRLGVGWQISGRAVASSDTIILLIHMRYAWQGDAVGT